MSTIIYFLISRQNKLINNNLSYYIYKTERNLSSGSEIRPMKRTLSISDCSPFGFSKKARSSCSGTPFSFSSPTASFIGELSVISPRFGRLSCSFVSGGEDSLDSLPTPTAPSTELKRLKDDDATFHEIPRDNSASDSFFSIASDVDSKFEDRTNSRSWTASDGNVDEELIKELTYHETIEGAVNAGQENVVTSATPALANLCI